MPDERRDEIIKAATNVEFVPDLSIERKQLHNATRIPFEKLTLAGVAFASVPEAFRTVSTSIPGGGEVLYRATDAAGKVIPSSLFQRFNDGTGMMGSIRVSGGFSQIRFHEVQSLGGNAVSTIPYDPTMLFMAAALAQINQKLDSIEKTQAEMFEFLRREKRSEQQADLNTLADILNNFKYNLDSETYLLSNHKLVLDIKNRAEKNILFYRDETMANLPKKKFVNLGKDVKHSGEAISESMRNYQLALYIYSFASFVEILLLGNFDAKYLKSISDKVDSYSFQYRKLYTDCYNMIEERAQSTIGAGTLRTAASLSKKLGDTIEKTRVGDKTQIDENLIGVSSSINKSRNKLLEKQTDRIICVKADVTLPFSQSIKTISYLYNQPFEVLADSEALYLSPIDKESK